MTLENKSFCLHISACIPRSPRGCRVFVYTFSHAYLGLRGAVAFAQSLHLPLANDRARNLIITTTLAIVVFTNVVLGGLTLPLVKVSFSLFGDFEMRERVDLVCYHCPLF